MNTKRLLRFTLALAVFAVTGLDSPAATRTWTGGALLNDRWTDKDNWSGDVPPVRGDALVFPTEVATTDKSMNNNFSAGTSFASLRFDDDGYRVNGNAFVLSGGISGKFGVDDVRIVAPMTLSVDQTIEWANGHLLFGHAFDVIAPIPLPPEQTINTDGHLLTVLGGVVDFDRVSGAGGIVIGISNRAGVATMQGLSTYTGITRVVSGDLSLEGDANLGSTAGPTVVHSNGRLILRNNNVLNEAISLEGGLVGKPGDSGAPSLNGPLSLVGPGIKHLAVDGSPTTFTVSGAITGSGTLLAFDANSPTSVILLSGTRTNTVTATLELSGQMHFQKPAFVPAWSGPIVLHHGGTLKLLASEQIADTAPLTVEAGGVANLNDRFETVSALNLGGTVKTGTGRLTIDGDLTALAAASAPTIAGLLRFQGASRSLNVSNFLAGDDLIVNAELHAFAASQTLIKNGNGSVVFNGGGVPMILELAGGAAEINGAHNGATIRLSGGALRGTGVVGLVQSTANLGGIVAPGPGLGILHCTGLAWNQDTRFDVELRDATPGSGHDQIDVNLGTVNLGGATLAVSAVKGFGTPIGQQLIIIANDGTDAITGTFAGLPEGAELTTTNGARFRITYIGGDGNDVALTTSFVPPTNVTLPWDGGDAVSSGWATAQNWNPNVAPRPGDSLLFGAAQDRSAINNLPAHTPFHQLSIISGGYALSGNPIDLSGGIEADFAAGEARVGLDLRLAQDQTFAARNHAELFLNADGDGDIDLNGHTLTFHTSGEASIAVGGQAGVRVPNPIHGAGDVIKTGPGTLLLLANNTFTAARLDGGTALFHGNNPTTIAMNGATLGGTGSVANLTSLAAGGIVSPGEGSGGLGVLTAGSIAWNPATAFVPELRDATSAGGHDQLHVRGTVNLGGATLLVTLLTNFTAVHGDTFVLIDNDGTDPVTGTFAGLPEGTLLSVSNRVFRISYTGGTGNDVQLTRTPAPSSELAGTFLTNGLRQFSGTGVPGARYVIEASTNLIHWQALGAATANTNGFYEFSDADTSLLPQRFYRTVRP
jgi:hypothetical protein